MILEKHNKKLALCMILVSIIMNVISYFYLPENLVMQVKTSGAAGTTLPTVLGLAAMFALLSLFAYKLSSSTETREKSKWLMVSILILVINAVTVILNLK